MHTTRSSQPRKQRRVHFHASPFGRRRQMAVALSRDLRGRYRRRALPLRKGDTVRIISGSFKGREERVSKVDLRTLRVTLDNVTIKKVDQKLKPLPIRSSHLILTRLNLADPWRRRLLHVTAAEAPPEEPAPEAPSATPAESGTSPAPAAPDSPATPPSAAPAETTAEAPTPKKRRTKPKPTEST